MKVAYMDEEDVALDTRLNPPFVEVAPRSCFSRLITELFDHSQRNSPSTVMLTSPHRKAGVSFICSNIAVELALQGEKVLLVDGRALLSVRLSPLQSVNLLCRRIGPLDLWVLAMEDVNGRSTSTETLTSSAVSAQIRELEKFYTYVLIDAPALSVGVDANILAASVYGTLLVARADHTRDEELRKACRTLRAVGGLVLGSVFNAH